MMTNDFFCFYKCIFNMLTSINEDTIKMFVISVIGDLKMALIPNYSLYIIYILY